MKFRQLYKEIKKKLQPITDGYASEAAMLMEFVTGRSFADITFSSDDEVSEKTAAELDALIEKRGKGYPIQYILGKWSFMDRDYIIGEGVLIPRDDTEVVVREVLKRAKNISSPHIYDLCSGSGIIAVTLAAELDKSNVTAIELSKTAFEYLKENVRLNNVQNVTALNKDILKCYGDVEDKSIDILVANPPYIETDRIPKLQRELQSEPMMALCGGDDGLYFYREILKYWTPKIKQGGVAAFEIGETQAEEITLMMQKLMYTDIRVIKDIQGLDRAVSGVCNMR